MEAVHWLGQHWFDFLQSAGIVGGLVFTAASLRTDAHVRRITNLLKITEHHRELWSQLHERPELARVLKADVDLVRNPVTPAEELFMKFVILHLNAAHKAIAERLFPKPDGLREDIRALFSLPIPKAEWAKAKPFQDEKFVRFVESNSGLDVVRR